MAARVRCLDSVPLFILTHFLVNTNLDWPNKPHLNVAMTTSLPPTSYINKISLVRDWWSTLCKWRFCQLQSYVTLKLGQISKIRPDIWDRLY